MKTASDGFTRMDVVAGLAGVILMVFAACPLLGNSKADSSRVVCFNNLRRLGIGAQLWGNDHVDRFPWITPVNEGGTRPEATQKAGVAWAEFLTLSNELAGPQLFACPNDPVAKVASQWGNIANGFANPGFRNNALSYFLSYHGRPELPRSVIAGDNDFRRQSSAFNGCSLGNLVNAFAFLAQPFPAVIWTNGFHSTAGHLLFTDGGVEYVSSARLHTTLVGPEAGDNGSIHFVTPR